MKINYKTISFLVFIIFIIFISSSYITAQGNLIVETDKSSYNYGETIRVTVTIVNDSDTSFTIWGSSSCWTNIGFDSVHFSIICTADYTPLLFPKYSSRSWVWELEPNILGIPLTSGDHKIYGFGAGQKDSIIISAPKFYGGYMQVNIKKETANLEMEQLRDSLNATIISSYTSTFDSTKSEVWQTIGHSIDSLFIAYQNDSRFNYFTAERWLSHDSSFVTTTESEIKIANDFVLRQNYPNPFNPMTTISYFIPEANVITLKIYDALGSEIATLVNEYQAVGDYNVNFYSNELSSGIYFYQIRTNNYIETKKMFLLK